MTACDGWDVLLQEVHSAVRFAERTPDWQRYHARAHTSTVELAALATRAHPALLVLYHQLYGGATDADLLRQLSQAGYAGRAVSARDFATYR